ncbi:unnamed protein product [Parajaminaea phylloscopi]
MQSQPATTLRDCFFAHCRVEVPIEPIAGRSIPRPKYQYPEGHIRRDLDDARRHRSAQLAQELLPSADQCSEVDPQEAEVAAAASKTIVFGDVPTQAFLQRNPTLLEHSLGLNRGFSTPRSASSITPAARSKSSPFAIDSTRRQSTWTSAQSQTVRNFEILVYRPPRARDAHVKVQFSPSLWQEILPTIVPDDLQLPTWDDLKTAYGITLTVKYRCPGSNERSIDRAARFLSAYWLGPLEVCQSIEEDPVAAAEQITYEFGVLQASFSCGRWARRSEAGIYIAPYPYDKARHHLTFRPESPSGRRIMSRVYDNLETAQQDAKILGAMLADPSWKSYSEDIIWLTWLDTVAGARYVEEWLQGQGGRNGTSAVGKAIIRRAKYKHCLAPGVTDGCYRQTVGQMCPANLGLRYALYSERWGIEADKFGFARPHVRAVRTDCEEMVTERICFAHWVSITARLGGIAFRLVLLPERDDPRLHNESSLLVAAEVPRIDCVLSAKGQEEIGLLTAIFLSTEDLSVATRAAHALNLLPKWARIEAVGRTSAGLADRIDTALDRSAIISASRASLDRIYPAIVLATGKIGAHVRENLRLVDTARNWAKGGDHPTTVADLLEAAVVCHNAVRAALGDEVADSRLQEIQARITSTWTLESQLLEDVRAKPWEWASRKKSQVISWKTADPVWGMLQSYPTASHEGMIEEVRYAADVLLGQLGQGEGERDSPSAEGTMPQEDPAPPTVQDEGLEATENIQISGNGQESEEATAPLHSFPAETGPEDELEDQVADSEADVLLFSEERLVQLALVVQQLETAHGRTLPRGPDSSLPYLFMPEHWSPRQILKYARQSDFIADNCDQCGLTLPNHIPAGADMAQQSAPSTIAAETKTNRSPATLYLKWVREELRGRLRTCPVTGLELVYTRLGHHSLDPLRASLAAHGTHGWPLDYGWTAPWPTTIEQYRGDRENVEVQSWFANKWLKSWRTPSLKATLLRRTEWFLNHGASALGITEPTPEEADQIRATCGARIELIGLPVGRPNSIQLGEQVVRMRTWS